MTPHAIGSGRPLFPLSTFTELACSGRRFKEEDFMMTAQHTPGPWQVDGEGLKSIVRSADLRIVAVRHRLGRDEHEANTRLIAAAPDLLEALKAAKELADVMEGLTSGRSDDEWVWAAQAKINAAIAKAEGR